jgi:hypothetical protein
MSGYSGNVSSTNISSRGSSKSKTNEFDSESEPRSSTTNSPQIFGGADQNRLSMMKNYQTNKKSLFVNTRGANDVGANSGRHSSSALNSSFDSLGELQMTHKTPARQSTFSNLDEEGTSPTGTHDIEDINALRGEIVKMAKTHVGSRTLQRFYSKCTEEEIQVVFEEIQDGLQDLMLDQYANFMFKNLTANSPQRIRVALIMKVRDFSFALARVVIFS